MTRSTCIHAYLHKLLMPGYIVSMSHVAGMMLHTRAVHSAIILTVTGQHTCVSGEITMVCKDIMMDGYIYAVKFCISFISLKLVWLKIKRPFFYWFLSPHKGNYCLMTLRNMHVSILRASSTNKWPTLLGCRRRVWDRKEPICHGNAKKKNKLKDQLILNLHTLGAPIMFRF